MLTRTSEYALRAMIYMAQHEDAWPLPGRTIAEDADIPAKYLSKVLGDLVRAGVLTSARGVGGGFSMVNTPRKTMLFDVLSPFEQFERMRCPFSNKFCDDTHPCQAHDRWHKVINTQQDFFRKTSVMDVAYEGSPKRHRNGKAKRAAVRRHRVGVS